MPTIPGDDLDNELVGTTTSDLFDARGGNDTIFLDANPGNDTFRGGDGADTVRLRASISVSQFILDATASVETLYFSIHNLSGTTGADLFNLSGVTSFVFGGLINLGNGDDQYVGFVGNDDVNGGTGNDTLDGGAGDDELTGSDGDDTLIGGSGDDRFYIGGSNFGTDYYNGGEGNDRVRLTGDVSVSSFILNASTTSGLEYLDFFLSRLNGTIGNDVFDISGIAEIISGETISLSDGDDSFVGHVGNDYVNGGTGNDTLSGGAGHDEFTGLEGADTLIGGSGDDRFYIGGNNFGADYYNGGEGNDRVRLTGDVSVSSFILNASTTSGLEYLDFFLSRLNGTTGDDLFDISGISEIISGETIFLNEGADRFTGHVGNDYVNGGTGDDVLKGEAGNDELTGGEGNDSLLGGSGNDWFFIGGNNFGSDYYLGAEGTDRIRLTSDVSVSRLILNANRANSIEYLDFYVSKLEGTTGNDVFDLSGIGEIVSGETIFLNDGADSFMGHVGADFVDGGTNNDRLNGGAGNDTIYGGEGNDMLIGGTGADRLYGGGGNDTYVVDNAADIVDETTTGAAGLDIVVSSVNYSLNTTAAAAVERLTLTGTAVSGTGNGLANTIVGNAFNNTLNGAAGNDTLNGGAGNDRLIGGLGVDVMSGGIGSDIYYVDNARDVVNEVGGNGLDLVISSVSFSLAGATARGAIENLTLSGAGNINGFGNAFNNVITGNNGANIVNGGAGNDTLAGGLGRDTLVGGAGADKFVFNTRLGGTNFDRINDFDASDVIVLDNAVMNALGVAGALRPNMLVENAAGAATSSTHRIIYETDTGNLFYDSDGNGTGAKVLFGQLRAGLDLNSLDFAVI